MSSTEPLLICISGGDASGKSTQAAALADELARDGVKVVGSSIWDALAGPDQTGFSDASDVFAYLAALPKYARSHFLFHALHVSLERAVRAAPDVVILNAYWYKYFATEVAHGADADTLRAVVSSFPVPARTFLLKVTPELALARKQERSDYESGYGDAGAFVEFQRHSQSVLQSLSSELGWTELDGTSDAKAITTNLYTAVRETLQ